MDEAALAHTCTDGPAAALGPVTPTYKNKRKMKEPRKRKDSVVKRPCQEDATSDCDPDESTIEFGGPQRQFPADTTPSPSGSACSISMPSAADRYPLTVPNVYSRLSSTFRADTPEPEAGNVDQSSAEWALSARKQRKNYKNMTRERRVEANARERTRVHAISSAFEGLRRAVPSYSYNQRLSKLAILRIACRFVTRVCIGFARRVYANVNLRRAL